MHANSFWTLRDYILELDPHRVAIIFRTLMTQYPFSLSLLLVTFFLCHRISGGNKPVGDQLPPLRESIISPSARALAYEMMLKFNCLSCSRFIYSNALVTIQSCKQYLCHWENACAAFWLVWPTNSRRLKIHAITCAAIVNLRHVAIQLAPLRLAHIATELNKESNLYPLQSATFVYIALEWLPGSDGPLDLLVSYLWTPVRHDTRNEIKIATFKHVQRLGLEFHLKQKKGEVLSTMAAEKLSELPGLLMLHFAPLLVDIIVALVSLTVQVDANYSIQVGIVTGAYIFLSLKISNQITRKRRKLNNARTELDNLNHESLEAYETMQYSNATEYEIGRYSKGLNEFHTIAGEITVFVNQLEFFKKVVHKSGLLYLCLSASSKMLENRGLIPMMALYTSLGRLQQPLEKLNIVINSIKLTLVDSEKLLQLFRQKPNVTDRPDAVPLESCCGDIKFQEVSFSYGSNPENEPQECVLNDLSFHCRPGTTTAIVGESGSGKSTIFNILYRFYNLQNGSIWVDGHNLQGVTVDSLRRHISVVPQDPFLLNNTLMYNLKYANHEATDEAVFAACRVAGIHEKIMDLPNGYRTQVGNRGMRLSGGQKQRVAIARALLKDTRIILLDEATAALDSNTETQLQASLDSLVFNRTVLIIAHRLSTIIAADQILVLHEGRIVEKGTHEELLHLEGGRYANMWSQHIRDASRN